MREKRCPRAWAAAAVAGLLAASVTAAPQAPAQSPTGNGELPAFEVASVKLVPPGSVNHSEIGPLGGASYTATGATLMLLISTAFGLDDADRILGAPNWLGSQRYDVNAKAESGVRLTMEALKPRLRQLLEQRFKLSAHRQTKDLDGFALVIAKGGPKLEKALPDRRAGIVVMNDGTGHTKMRLTNVSVGTLAAALGRALGDPVADKTGIQGEYDMVLDYENDPDVGPSLPSVLKAVQEQLGLKLEKQKVTVEMLAIDHVERIPTEN
ncbi:MAG TPA: TIGR03435 family protein [Bryobacteraceae bacterium]|nr:TIGR03435 family protein [Bryobacteraceae bacterium]